MAVLKTVLSVLMIIICVVLTVIVLLQEGKQNGLGSLSGQTDTYWSKNKGRSREGRMVKITSALVVLFFVLSIVLNLNVF